jgi:ABC-type enterochelin transport system ATPase subunit
MVLHDLNVALDLSDRLIGMKDGRCSFVIDDKADIDAKVMSELFDVSFDMHSFDSKNFISFK